MSEHHDEHGHGHGHWPQEEDRIDTRRIVTVGVVSLLVFAVGIVWTTRVQRDMNDGSLRNEIVQPVRKAGQVEVGNVFQPMFLDTPLAADWIEEKRQRLNSLGWADPEHQQVHIPIDRAMKLVIEKGKL